MQQREYVRLSHSNSRGWPCRSRCRVSVTRMQQWTTRAQRRCYCIGARSVLPSLFRRAGYPEACSLLPLCCRCTLQVSSSGVSSAMSSRGRRCSRAPLKPSVSMREDNGVPAGASVAKAAGAAPDAPEDDVGMPCAFWESCTSSVTFVRAWIHVIASNGVV